MTHCDLLFRNVRLATMAEGAEGSEDGGYGLVDRGALAVAEDRIAWVGEEAALPAPLTAAREVDGQGRLLTPGLIDCHTHLVWAGDRVDEFEQRLEGVAYSEIARRGGGIVSSVRALRAASRDELETASARRLEALVREGVTRVEIKSGYGLDLENETKSLQVARALGERGLARVHTTFLGAHAVPPEFAGDRAGYLDRVCEEMLPAITASGLADAVDAFCESIAFTPEEVDRLFGLAREAGLPVKLHAEQLSNLGGAALAARHGALSADHLEYLDEAGVLAMAEAGTVAVLLPGAFYFLHETQKPPVELLRRHGVPIAVATDLNPGSSPVAELRTALNMSCVLFGLTPTEALLGATRHAAQALGVGDEAGTLEVGKLADLALWNARRPAELVAGLGQPLCEGRWIGGEEAS